jgi:ankyrin repeat protein
MEEERIKMEEERIKKEKKEKMEKQMMEEKKQQEEYQRELKEQKQKKEMQRKKKEEENISYMNYNSSGYNNKINKFEYYESNKMKKQIYTKTEVYEYTKEEKELMELLYNACENEDIKVISACLKGKILFKFLDGAYVNEPNKNGDYAIHLIFKRKKKEEILEALKALIEEKKVETLNINAKNKSSETPLHLACKLADSQVIDYLLDKGADADIKDKDGNTCLHLLEILDNDKSYNEYLIIFEKILDYGAELKIKNNDGKLIGQITKNNKFILKLSDYQFNQNEEVIGGDVEVGLSWKNRYTLFLIIKK